MFHGVLESTFTNTIYWERAILSKSNHDFLHCILVLPADESCKLSPWHSGMSDVEFNVVHLVGIKRYVAEALLQLSTSWPDKNNLRILLLVLKIMQYREEKLWQNDTSKVPHSRWSAQGNCTKNPRSICNTGYLKSLTEPSTTYFLAE